MTQRILNRFVIDHIPLYEITKANNALMAAALIQFAAEVLEHEPERLQEFTTKYGTTVTDLITLEV